MSAFTKAGVRQTKAGIAKTAVPDPAKVRLTNAIYEDFTFPGTNVKGRRLKHSAGAELTPAEFDAMFPQATFVSKTPATGLAAGGTVVTITGTNLDGVTSVTFDGTPGTALQLLSDTQIRVTTPAKAIGSYAVVIVDDSGNVAAGNQAYT